jgi:hypothetical protein
MPVINPYSAAVMTVVRYLECFDPDEFRAAPMGEPGLDVDQVLAAAAQFTVELRTDLRQVAKRSQAAYERMCSLVE